MEKIIRKGIIAVSLIFAIILQSSKCDAKIETIQGNPFVEMAKIRCSCYCEHGVTASGRNTCYGIVAGKEEWLGYVCEVNKINEDGSVGEFVGYFEFCDTGAGMDMDGDGKGDSIKTGNSIDIWVESLDKAYEWRDEFGDYVYIKIINAKG